MKLYFSPGACSLSPHIVAREAGLPLTLVRVDTKSKRTATGADYWDINGKGSVPVLELDNGIRLTEGPAIVQYLADHAPQKHLAAAYGTMERYRLQEWLNFITSELHKQFSPLFDATMPEEAKAKFRDKLAGRFDWIVKQLGDQPYLTGTSFSVADAYLFTVQLDPMDRHRPVALAGARAVRGTRGCPARCPGGAQGRGAAEVGLCTKYPDTAPVGAVS